MGTFQVSSAILFTSFNYPHFHTNFFCVFTLLALIYRTACSMKDHKAQLVLLSSLRNGKRRTNAATWQVTARENPGHKPGPWCTAAIYRQRKTHEVGVAVGSARPASASRKQRSGQWDICSELTQHGKNNCTAATILLNRSQWDDFIWFYF